MVPPQTESNLQHYPTKNYGKNIYSPSDDLVSDSRKISKKLPEELFEKTRTEGDPQKYPSDDKQVNGKIDLFYLRAREVILASGSLPGELELRENGVFAKALISKGTRYGPFQGKWASIPQDLRFAWEVSPKLNYKINYTNDNWCYFFDHFCVKVHTTLTLKDGNSTSNCKNYSSLHAVILRKSFLKANF